MTMPFSFYETGLFDSKTTSIIGLGCGMTFLCSSMMGGFDGISMPNSSIVLMIDMEITWSMKLTSTQIVADK